MTGKQEEATLKKLMRIIYDKQKEIDKYKKQLRQKQRSKVPAVHTTELGLSEEERQFITHQIIENKRFLSTATAKLRSMQKKILELQADLDEQENRNQILQEQLRIARFQCEEREKTIHQLKTMKQLLENAKLNNNGEISQKEGRIQSLVIENQNIKRTLEQLNGENSQLKQRFLKIQNQANKALKFLYKNLKFFDSKNKSNVDLNLNFSRVIKASEQQIRTQTFIYEKLQMGVEEKMAEALELMNRWSEALHLRECEWKKNFERALQEHSFDGISGLISESNLMRDEENLEKKDKENDSNFYETSVYKRNEEQLLKQLEEECEKSHVGPVSMEKQKLVELSEVKQSLKMTKQVNEQLFDELNRQENIIKAFRETFSTLERKKLVKLDGNEEFQKLRSVLGVKN